MPEPTPAGEAGRACDGEGPPLTAPLAPPPRPALTGELEAAVAVSGDSARAANLSSASGALLSLSFSVACGTAFFCTSSLARCSDAGAAVAAGGRGVTAGDAGCAFASSWLETEAVAG